MKHISTFESFLNEAKKYKGIDLNQSLDTSDFGEPVKDAKDLKMGSEYILWEPGMNEWVGNYVFQGIVAGGGCIFKSTLQFEDSTIELSTKDVKEYVKQGKIINQR